MRLHTGQHTDSGKCREALQPGCLVITRERAADEAVTQGRTEDRGAGCGCASAEPHVRDMCRLMLCAVCSPSLSALRRSRRWLSCPANEKVAAKDIVALSSWLGGIRDPGFLAPAPLKWSACGNRLTFTSQSFERAVSTRRRGSAFPADEALRSACLCVLARGCVYALLMSVKQRCGCLCAEPNAEGALGFMASGAIFAEGRTNSALAVDKCSPTNCYEEEKGQGRLRKD